MLFRSWDVQMLVVSCETSFWVVSCETSFFGDVLMFVVSYERIVISVFFFFAI